MKPRGPWTVYRVLFASGSDDRSVDGALALSLSETAIVLRVQFCQPVRAQNQKVGSGQMSNEGLLTVFC